MRGRGVGCGAQGAHEVLLQLRDVHGNRALGSEAAVNAALTDPDGAAALRAPQIAPLGGGAYAIKLWLPRSGSWSLNVTLNGIPINDSESQAVFWVNMPDLASGTDDIQVQRGVGTSTLGAGAFGATISLNTLNIAEEAGGSMMVGGGSFNTFRTKLLAIWKISFCYTVCINYKSFILNVNRV